MSPAFSVVMATFGRGRHILPSIRSVLGQTFQDFELLIVGDGCSDGTEEAVRPLLSEKVRWHNLPERGGSQSYPNNEGLRLARGRHMAYLGHDDIWAGDHLERAAGILESDPEVDFVVAGCIFYGPPGSGSFWVTGLFEDDAAKFTHFFPPSSFAHRRGVVERIGPWRGPREIRAPVDSEFLLRAAQSGMRFRSTRTVTCHKFAAGHRYLSYLRQDSSEQEALLARLREPSFDAEVRNIVEQAKEDKTFMIIRNSAFEEFEAGELAERNERNKGIARPELRPLERQTLIVQDTHPRALDWLLFAEGETRTRWSDQNPTPQLLIPFTSAGPARLRLQLSALQRGTLEELKIRINDAPVNFALKRLRRGDGAWEATADLIAALREEDFSIVVFELPHYTRHERSQWRLGVAEIAIEPCGGASESGFDEVEAERFYRLLVHEEACRQKVAQELTSCQKTLCEQEQRIADLTRRLATSQATNDRLEDSLSGIRAECARLSAALEEARSQAAAREACIVEQNQILERIRSRVSWKLSAPLREVERFFQKLARRR